MHHGLQNRQALFLRCCDKNNTLLNKMGYFFGRYFLNFNLTARQF
jgi:hypothetical protein